MGVCKTVDLAQRVPDRGSCLNEEAQKCQITSLLFHELNESLFHELNESLVYELNKRRRGPQQGSGEMGWGQTGSVANVATCGQLLCTCLAYLASISVVPAVQISSKACMEEADSWKKQKIPPLAFTN